MPDSTTVQTGGAAVAHTSTIPDNMTATEGNSTSIGNHGHAPLRVTNNGNTAAPVEKPVLSDTPRPDWLPANFKSVADFQKSYSEAQAKITQQAQELAELKKATPSATTSSASQTPAATTQSSTQTPSATTEAVKAVTPGPLDMGGLAAEWAANGGKFTEQTYARMAAVGISQDMAHQFIAGQQAIAERNSAALDQIAGGREKLEQILNYYGSDPLREAEARAYNKALGEGRLEDAKMMMKAMKSAYQDRVGRDPRVFISGTEAARAATEQPFQSMAEMTTAMRDPKYQTDPIYRRSVERRAFGLSKPRS